MCGSATFATEVSSIAMNVAGMTEAAINQGLKVGVHPCLPLLIANQERIIFHLSLDICHLTICKADRSSESEVRASAPTAFLGRRAGTRVQRSLGTPHRRSPDI